LRNIADTKYVLVETSFTGFPADLLDILYQLLKKGFQPILAHPERYYDIVNQRSLAEDLLYRNVYLQMNAGSILGFYGKQVQKTAVWLMENHLIHFVASDTHCNSDTYLLQEAYLRIGDHTNQDLVKLLSVDNPKLLMKDQPIEFFIS